MYRPHGNHGKYLYARFYLREQIISRPVLTSNRLFMLIRRVIRASVSACM